MGEKGDSGQTEIQNQKGIVEKCIGSKGSDKMVKLSLCLINYALCHEDMGK
jgi:hypothetical protein